jgi:glycosyltransferase involved in cell wall biosynthesis
VFFMSNRGPTTRVLFLSFVPPFPLDNGKKVVLHGLARYLSSRPGTRVDYVVLGAAEVAAPPETALTFRAVGIEQRWSQPFKAILQSIARRQPLQQTMLYSRRLREDIRRQITDLEPDIVVYDTIRVSQFLDHPHALLPRAKHILYLEDLFSVRYAAMLRAMDDHPDVRVNPLGNFARHVPKSSELLVNARPLCRYLLEREMRLVQQVEAQEVAKFDVSLLVNEAEAELLRQRSGHDRITAVPIALPPRDRPLPPRDYRGRPDFVFMGALNVAHNQSSLEYFIAHVFDECVKGIPDLKLIVIGQRPSQRLRDLLARYPNNIERIEWLADLGEIFRRSAAMIVPLLFGSGVKVKTLEALRFGLPVIGTKFSAEGIVSDPRQPSGIIIEDDVHRFPLHMRALLRPDLNNRLSAQASEYFSANHGEAISAKRYEALFDL